MAAVASVAAWIPEDDLLLKKAVESGASLEALAKGAVRFSRKFTFRELRDRWHSLLYDPIISEEASSSMIEYEISAKKSGTNKENSENTGKRKSESIRRLYYAMRKRICSQSVNSVFSDEPDVSGYICSGDLMHDTHIQGLCRDEDASMDILDPALIPAAAKDNVGNGGSVRKDSRVMLSEKVPLFPAKQLLTKNDGNSFKLTNHHEDNLGMHVDETRSSDCSILPEMGPCHVLPDANASNHLMAFSSPHSRSPLWKTIEDVQAPAMLMNDKIRAAEEVMELHKDLVGEKVCLPNHDDNSEKILNSENAPGPIGISTAMSESDFDCLLNYELDILADADEKGTTDKACTESVILQALDNVSSIHNDDIPLSSQIQTLDSSTCLANRQDANLPSVVDMHGDRLHCNPRYQHSRLEHDNLSSRAAPDHHHADIGEESMVCILNKEDPEIPCNDDFIPSTSYQGHKACGGMALALASNNKETREQGRGFLKKEKNHTQFSKPGQKIGPGTSPNCGPIYPLDNAADNSEFPGSSYLNYVSRMSFNAQLDQNPGITALDPLNTNGDQLVKLESSSVSNARVVQLHTDAEPTRDDYQEHEGTPSIMDPEESEGFDDIPCFSDIEAMILDMDLCPDAQDTTVKKELPRYSSVDAKRAIIRLEQCFQSSIRRNIASRGGLAILYGRYSKHFIRKPEVILGRSTYDLAVDIDLGRGGGANKISRRQALIKLEKDGSFSLKNIGRCSMFLDGKELMKGQRLNLSPGCVIEVKGISLLFEMNPESVRHYLGNLQ